MCILYEPAIKGENDPKKLNWKESLTIKGALLFLYVGSPSITGCLIPAGCDWRELTHNTLRMGYIYVRLPVEERPSNNHYIFKMTYINVATSSRSQLHWIGTF